MVLKYNIYYEVASALFLIELLFFIKMQYNTNSILNKEFRKLTWMGLIATILDVTTAITISNAASVPVQLNTLLNTLYFVSVALLGYQMMYYDLLFIYRNEKKSPLVRFNRYLLGVYFIILLFNMFTGYFFSFTQDGAYVKGCFVIILIYNFQRRAEWC